MPVVANGLCQRQFGNSVSIARTTDFPSVPLSPLIDRYEDLTIFEIVFRARRDKSVLMEEKKRYIGGRNFFVSYPRGRNFNPSRSKED